MYKYLTVNIREYIFIILTATIFSLISFSKSFSQENVFNINNIKVGGSLDINFSREQYINKAFKNSFKMLMPKILVSRDLGKLDNLKINKIRKLISSFRILEETYIKNEYEATFDIAYDENKVKKMLAKKNISFSQPKNISVVFFPVLFVNDEVQNFNENYFYNHWSSIKIENELINFIIPLEDLDDLAKIKEMKNTIEEINVDFFVSKYNTQNYVFVFMNYDYDKINIHLKTNFENNKVSKNVSYNLNNIEDERKLKSILEDLKMQITDIWKESNVVNLSMPLSIRIKYEHLNLIDLNKLKKTFYEINIINNYTLEELNINHSYFKIYYYGNPRKLKTELLKFGYLLKDDRGYWEIYVDE